MNHHSCGDFLLNFGFFLNGILFIPGKDGTRALITGDFHDESKNKDHILDLKCNEIFTLLTWQDTFTEKYVQIGMYMISSL